jgi:acyl-CoA reductase-like NAD-dependent aldehyde dehydrogenase
VSTPATSHDFTDDERREQVQAFRLEQAEAQLRAARRAAEEFEQEPAVQTLRVLQRIERLLIERLPALDVPAQ